MREKTHNYLEFRPDKKVRDSALLHIKKCTGMSEIGKQVLAVCTKDLISSEAKYHASCYKLFVKIINRDEDNENADEKEDQDDTMDIYDAFTLFAKICLNFRE